MSVARTREGKTNKIGIVANCMEAQEKKKSVERRKFKLTFALE